ncbi:MAG: polyphosphate kinase 2 [Thermoleophilia bacterium]|nr:polyphosphate kinase 2 [Thermoleophilia bacterium]
MKRKEFEAELAKLQVELAKLQYWIAEHGLRVAVIFEGRDTAGKGGVIRRITQRLNPRVVRIVALPKPTEREQGQWYFQRYVPHMPAAGELVLFDRSWYNRAGVEPVMGFCTQEEHQRFLRHTPTFERMLLDDGIILIKYWLEVGPETQRERLAQRIDDTTKHWKVSPIDLEAQSRYYDYSRARDTMFAHTDTPESPWHVVPSDDQRAARLNCVSHLLSLIPYKTVTREELVLPDLQDAGDYSVPEAPRNEVPDLYGQRT